ncbi:hypothetical protein ACFXPQ_20365 [Streptomyces lydicus]|uniref:hypothetical protein n=1 Tax=Streptomyces lydicus TaxID=47763 RepID=UPI0036CE3EE7
MSGSSNEPVRVDTAKLRDALYQLTQVSQHVKSAAERFLDDCDADSDAIGEDKSAKKFREKYDGPHKDALDAGFQSAQLLERTSGEVQQLIRALEDVEQRSAETGQRLNPEINGG